MLSWLFGTDSFMEMLGTPTFWYTIIILIGIIVLLVACIRYWNKGGKWILGGIFVVIYTGLTVFSGININAYYSERGGIYGAITGIFDTNEVEVVSSMEFKFKNMELTQVGESDTYSASIVMNEVFALDKDVDYMVFVNDMPCTFVENASDYVLADYRYAFYDDNFEMILEDTLNFRFAFYTNSTSLKVMTNGGSEALKYWHHYFNKNTFIVKIAEVKSLDDYFSSYSNGDISNFCKVSYVVDEEVICVQIYQKGSTINLIDVDNENYNIWLLNNAVVDDAFIVLDDIVLFAGFYEIPGLYNNGKMVYSWDELIVNDFLNLEDGVLSSDSRTSELSGKLVFNDNVVRVSASTFSYCANLKEVVMSDSVERIDDVSFNYTGIESIKFSNSLNYIGASAFAQCDNLKEVVLPSSLRKMTYNTFSGCDKLERIDILNGLNELLDTNFRYCNNLKYVFIPCSITTINSSVFYGITHSFTIYYEGLNEPVLFESGWSVNANVKYGYSYEEYLSEIQSNNSVEDDSPITLTLTNNLTSSVRVVCSNGEYIVNAKSNLDINILATDSVSVYCGNCNLSYSTGVNKTNNSDGYSFSWEDLDSVYIILSPKEVSGM